MLQPRHLRENDLVALVAPSGAVPEPWAVAAVEVVRGWGLRARLGDNALNRWTHLAGTDAERLADLNAALRDEEVRGVICLRGGYGVQRIVDGVDYAAVRADPKLVLGFSDLTALHAALWREAGVASVHGPTAAQFVEDADALGVRGARRALMSPEPVTVAADEAEDTFGVRVAGTARGTLLGGNLTMLAATAGTRHALDLDGAILLIEAVGEEPYRVDRSLVQLKRAGWFAGIRGVAVGQFAGCVDDGGPSVSDVLLEQLGSLGVPVLGGLPIGHGDQQVAVGLGVPAVLDAGAGTLVVRAAGR
ncbi:LD-carboxypeptidase [Longispora sp. NPDC051575]|uniref:S66 peptidase family protein n=1 Tax=Longispora sp. NPDC051575 TaxID=3154943 RepID=UPI003443C0CC